MQQQRPHEQRPHERGVSITAVKSISSVSDGHSCICRFNSIALTVLTDWLPLGRSKDELFNEDMHTNDDAGDSTDVGIFTRLSLSITLCQHMCARNEASHAARCCRARLLPAPL